MLFDDKKQERVSEERLAEVLGEKPAIASAVQDHPYDRCRALVIALLLTSVAGTWSVAYFLGHP